MFSIIFLILAVLGASAHLFLSRKPKTADRIISILLLYLLAISVGVGGLFGFMGHAFRADQVAQSIGWDPGSPFQFEIAVSNLAFGILGILCIWIRGNFWIATGIGSSIFALGAAYGHIRDIMVNQNLALYNAGPILWVGDILIPLLILSLLILLKTSNKCESISSSPS